MTRPESLLCRVFREHFRELVHSVQDPDSLADDLLSHNLLGWDTIHELQANELTRQEKTRKILLAVSAQIAVQPYKVWEFLEVLRRDSSRKKLAEKIELAMAQCDKAELKDLVNELCDIREWFLFGINLNLSPNELRQIEDENHYIKNRIVRVLQLWQQQDVPKWSKVIQALVKAREGHKAKEIAHQHGVSYCTEEVPNGNRTVTLLQKIKQLPKAQFLFLVGGLTFHALLRLILNEILSTPQKESEESEKDNADVTELQMLYHIHAEVRRLSEKKELDWDIEKSILQRKLEEQEAKVRELSSEMSILQKKHEEQVKETQEKELKCDIEMSRLQRAHEIQTKEVRLLNERLQEIKSDYKTFCTLNAIIYKEVRVLEAHCSGESEILRMLVAPHYITGNCSATKNFSTFCHVICPALMLSSPVSSFVQSNNVATCPDLMLSSPVSLLLNNVEIELDEVGCLEYFQVSHQQVIYSTPICKFAQPSVDTLCTYSAPHDQNTALTLYLPRGPIHHPSSSSNHSDIVPMSNTSHDFFSKNRSSVGSLSATFVGSLSAAFGIVCVFLGILKLLFCMVNYFKKTRKRKTRKEEYVLIADVE